MTIARLLIGRLSSGLVNGARVAFWIAPNVEHYEYLPEFDGLRDPWPRVPYPDVQQYAFPGLRQPGGVLADAGAVGQVRHQVLRSR